MDLSNTVKSIKVDPRKTRALRAMARAYRILYGVRLHEDHCRLRKILMITDEYE